jgi:Lrp/AsnC family transcriptional regulator for asnA, asnC and gidA
VTTLDKDDLAIIKELQMDGRASYSKLSKKIGMPSSTIHDKVKRLIFNGVIKGYTIIIDKEKVGLNNVAIIGVETGAKQFRDVAKSLCEIREIEEVYGTTAEFDLMVKVRASSREELSDALNRIRSLDGVDDIYVSSILEVFKEEPTLPL